MAAISIDPDVADSTVSAFSSSHGDITSNLSSLRSSADSVLSTWNGNSRSQFETAWGEWCQGLGKLLEDLESLRAGIQIEAQQFREADQAFNRG